MKEEIERILRNRFTRGDIQTAANELLDLFNVSLSLMESEEEYEPYFGWCDVEGCEIEGANGGGCWRETGYWTVCSKHSQEYREGKPQPPMKQSAIDREKRRGADGVLVNNDNRLLPDILFQDEINTFLKEQFYETWMDDNDWLMFLEALETQSGVSVQSLSNDLQVGLKNGHSIEKQFELVRAILKNGSKD